MVVLTAGRNRGRAWRQGRVVERDFPERNREIGSEMVLEDRNRFGMESR